MGGHTRDNWAKLFGVLQRREDDRYLAYCPSQSSIDSSSVSSSPAYSFNYGSHDLQNEKVLGAREINITWGSTPEYWKFTSDPDSRFQEVAELERVWWLDINCKVEMKNLSPKTNYGAYLLFKLTDDSYGLATVHGYVRITEHETRKKAEERASLLHLKPKPGETLGQVARPRADGWMEIKLGDFINGTKGKVEARMLEIWSRNVKSGLIVEGIEFRPNN